MRPGGETTRDATTDIPLHRHTTSAIASLLAALVCSLYDVLLVWVLVSESEKNWNYATCGNLQYADK